jgi:uncharacterized protein (TIGR02001 family)
MALVRNAKMLKTIAGAVFVMTAMTGNAYADVSSPFTGDVQYMTNYIGRGLAQSVGQPSVSAEFDYSPRDGLYGGVDLTSINWIDQLYPGDSVSVELDGWAGYRNHFGEDWTGKLGVLRLQFPGRYAEQTPPVARPDTTEAFAYLAWKTFSAQLNYSITESFGTPDSKGSWYLDLAANQPLNSDWKLIVHLGRKHAAGADPVSGVSHRLNDYTDYKFGIGYQLGAGVQLTLAHTWTNADPARYTLNGYDVGGHHTWLLLEKDF